MSMAARRFYKDVSVGPSGAGYAVQLDGKALKTPGKHPLIVPREDVARLIAEEWEAQEEQIRPETMPVTRLANVALEITPTRRDKLYAEARSYGQTDLLCYRADAPDTLTERQSAAWDPVLTWAASQGFDFRTTQYLRAVDQDEATLDRISAYAQNLDDFNLTLFLHLTATFGSVILAMAVMEGYLTGEQAYELSRLDEQFQIDQWGEDEEAAQRAALIGGEVKALCRVLET